MQPSSPAAAPAPRTGSFLARRLAELDQELAATLPRVRGERESDAEALHDMRVALRRLRTILRTARPVYGRFHADAVRRAFTDAQRATGVLRDEEVLGETLAAIDLKDPAFHQWRDRRKVRERALRRAVRLELETGELEAGRALLKALITLPVKPSRDPALVRFAQRCAQRAERDVESQSGARVDDSPALHDLRIAYKHLRYAIEIFAEALPPIVTEKARSAVQFQKRLGEIHDVDVAIETVTRARGMPAATRGRVLRALRKMRDEQIGKYLLLREREHPAPAVPSRPSSRLIGPARTRRAVTPSEEPRSGRARLSSARRPVRDGRLVPSPPA